MSPRLRLVGLLASSVAAQNVDVLPVADASLFEDPAGALADGLGPHLYVGRTNSAGGYGARRGLLRFDVAAAVPPGFEVVSASLVLHQSSFNGNPTTVALHRTLTPWSEGPSNAGSPGGGGAPAVAGDATWTHAVLPSAPWVAAGGDFEPVPDATVPVINPGFYVFGPTPALTAAVRDLRANPASDFGWLLKTTDEQIGIAKRFDSRENPGFEPVLSIVYAPAFPASAATFGAGCVVGGPGPFRWSFSGPPIIGDPTFTLGLHAGPALGAASVFIAGAPAATPLDLGGGCSVLLDLPSLAALLAAGVSPLGPLPLDAAGGAVIPLPIAPDPALVGFAVFGQAFAPAATPTGFGLSDGLHLVFGV